MGDESETVEIDRETLEELFRFFRAHIDEYGDRIEYWDALIDAAEVLGHTIPYEQSIVGWASEKGLREKYGDDEYERLRQRFIDHAEGE